MKVKFIKAHPVGIPEGTVRDVRKPAAERWLEQGYIEIVDGEIKQDAPKSKEKGKKK
jgi:hypothetical protein